MYEGEIVFRPQCTQEPHEIGHAKQKLVAMGVDHQPFLGQYPSNPLRRYRQQPVPVSADGKRSDSLR